MSEDTIRVSQAAEEAAQLRLRMDELSARINSQGRDLGRQYKWLLCQQRAPYGEAAGDTDYEELLSASHEVDTLVEEYFTLEKKLRQLDGGACTQPD